ncbi:TetR/AcrR family transcriptional regulator [uncultured Jannaschia sp.]|uniref:TetR/AcrR family transcriptional regulator n=1 Tax=uncultured Jannaschia sp. TaxID=293347 RepID=UPI0026323E41|nr:TetR/AcrR family transcriptional regulator [uncultured Jannaschia sp.]
MAARRSERQQAVSEHKRALILDAAREVFADEGLEGASLRAIATRAGYAPAALYFHFESKEAIYAEVLRGSLVALGEYVGKAVGKAGDASARLRAAAMAFFRFYAENPRDLDLGFYLFRGGMKPKGLGWERDEYLNKALASALHPIAEAAMELGTGRPGAELLVVDTFAHATGLLLLLHTGRIRMFDASAAERMEAYIDDRLDRLSKGAK